MDDLGLDFAGQAAEDKGGREDHAEGQRTDEGCPARWEVTRTETEQEEVCLTTMINRFFGVHQYLLRSGLWARMKPSEKDLYVGLMHESERNRTRELIRSDADIAVLTGVSTRALRDARIKLQERGLIKYEVRLGRGYRYVICDPETGLPYPGDPKVRVPYIRKGTTVLSPHPTNAGVKRTTAPASRPATIYNHRETDLPVRGVELDFK